MEKQKIPFTIKDISKQPPSIEELQKMLGFQNGNLTKLINTSGQLYRSMQLSKKLKDLSSLDILTLLNSHGMLIKRPFLIGIDFGLTGFKEAEWSQKILEDRT